MPHKRRGPPFPPRDASPDRAACRPVLRPHVVQQHVGIGPDQLKPVFRALCIAARHDISGHGISRCSRFRRTGVCRAALPGRRHRAGPEPQDSRNRTSRQIEDWFRCFAVSQSVAARPDGMARHVRLTRECSRPSDAAPPGSRSRCRRQRRSRTGSVQCAVVAFHPNRPSTSPSCGRIAHPVGLAGYAVAVPYRRDRPCARMSAGWIACSSPRPHTSAARPCGDSMHIGGQRPETEDRPMHCRPACADETVSPPFSSEPSLPSYRIVHPAFRRQGRTTATSCNWPP